MERTATRSWSASGEDLSRPTNLDSRDETDPRWTVLVSEPLPSRRQLIERMVSECGARPRWVEGFSHIALAEFSARCTLAIVALGSCPSTNDCSLQGIRSLNQKGFKVVCYEEGAQSWPLSARCQVLLAGASWLLDSAEGAFPRELRRIVIQLLQSEAGRRDEEQRIQHVMKKLGSVGESQAILTVFRAILRASTLSDLPILIMGETGTGKERLAHAIHELDLKRCKGPFVALNCSAISSGLAESELFGHRRGAFTGADRDRKGLIRSADGGVLFLDEIGELDDALQAKLLRVLQENRVLAVGEDREVPVSVRIIAATNRNLSAMVQQGDFRADLFHRLNVLTIHIPPLRARRADLKPLIEHFLKKYQSLKPATALSVDPDFIEALSQLELPGNVRQIENLVRWALVNKDDNTPLNLSDLPLEIWQQLAEQAPPGSQVVQAGDAQEGQQLKLGTPRPDLPSYIVELLDMNGWNLSRSLQHCERLLIEAALDKTHGNQSQTARLLGITPRSVYNKVHKHQLHR